MLVTKAVDEALKEVLEESLAAEVEIDELALELVVGESVISEELSVKIDEARVVVAMQLQALLT